MLGNGNNRSIEGVNWKCFSMTTILIYSLFVSSYSKFCLDMIDQIAWCHLSTL